MSTTTTEGLEERRAEIAAWLAGRGVNISNVCDDFRCVVTGTLVYEQRRLTYMSTVRPSDPAGLLQVELITPSWVTRPKYLVELVAEMPDPPGWDPRYLRWNASMYLHLGRGVNFGNLG